DAGSIDLTDLDLSDTPPATEVTLSVTPSAGLTLTAGQQTALEDAFSISAAVGNDNNGTINWDYSITEGELDFLAAGESVTVVYTITVDDANGGSDTQDVTITINGSNDAPVITAGVVTGTITEGSTLTDAGSIDFTDLDLTDRPTASQATKDVTTSVAGGLTAAQEADIVSAFSITDLGNTNNGTIDWDYTITEGELDFLAEGETVTAVFTITVTDNDGATDTQDVTINITGTNDAPTVSNVAVGATEDGATVNGSFVVSDVDTTDTHTFTITSSPGEGSVVNNGNGTFTFDPGTDFQDLALGETRDVTFTYTATDDSLAGNDTSTAATVTVTVTGTTDRPVVSNIASAATEDGATVNGSFVVSDADTSDTHTFDITSSTSEGSVIINNDGTFTFDTGSDFQDLALGKTRDVTFTYTTIDDSGAANDTSTSAIVTITVTGTNDQPTVSNVDVNVIEGTTGGVEGSFSASDVDTADTHNFTITSSPSGGSVVNNGDGTFTFNPGTDFQDLAPGQARDITFTYTATDNNGAISTSATVTVTVIGGIPDDAIEPTEIPIDVITPPPPGIDPIESKPVVNTEYAIAEVSSGSSTLNKVHNSIDPVQLDAAEYDYEIVIEQRQLMQSLKYALATSMELWEVIDLMKKQINDADRGSKNYMELLAKSASGMTLSLSAGVVTWALRGTSILAGMLSAVPTWRAFDPLPVFAVAKRIKRKDDSKDTDSTHADEHKATSLLDDTSSGENSNHD
ncbi:MAG: hypothetical protein GQ537_05105, partial [Gammaproteobacteria bacterium]|nr:hypothetical protein [Gammaproteobacteria bacterium]